MKKQDFLIVLCFLLLISPGDGGKSDFVLVLSWPMTFCTFEACSKPIPERFIIHGLWQQDATIIMNKEPYSTSKLKKQKTLRKEMELHWPSLGTTAYKENDDFWKHEWKFHGAYTGLHFEKYFEKTLLLGKQVIEEVEKALKQNGIKSSDSQTYTSEDIGQAIELTTKVAPELHCKQLMDGTVFLHEVRFYLNETFQLQEAAKYMVKNTLLITAKKCGNRLNIKFPPVPPNRQPPIIHSEL